jgi:hypothetical protein
MPAIEVRRFKNENGNIPIQRWLDDLEKHESKTYEACLDAIMQLAELGNDLRPPQNRFLRNGIYELRIKVREVHHRILYFFCKHNFVTLSDGIRAKKGKVDPQKIDAAISHSKLVEAFPDKYTA